MMMYIDENGMFTTTPPDPTKKTVFKAEDIEIHTPKKEDLEDVDTTRRGVVTFFNDSKGFGFIRDTETRESVFVHVNNLVDEIKENNVVTFETEMGQKGPVAINVKLSK
jgi:cold shock CspA family protein